MHIKPLQDLYILTEKFKNAVLCWSHHFNGEQQQPEKSLGKGTVAHTGCNRRNVQDFGRVFLRSNYTDITQNTYIQS